MKSSTDTILEGGQSGYDAGDRRAVDQRKKDARQRELRHLAGLKQMMGTTEGRVWMWDLLASCGVFQGDFNGNSRDYFNLGRRNVGLPIFAALQSHCMNEYATMVKENSNAG